MYDNIDMINQVNDDLNTCEQKLSSMDSVVKEVMRNEGVSQDDKQVVMNVDELLDAYFDQIVSVYTYIDISRCCICYVDVWVRRVVCW